MKIEIIYCGMWNYEPQASRLEEEIKNVYSNAQITLVRSSGGVFEVSVDENLIFSKKELDRFPNEKEILNLMK